jgi:hypothetical protein
MVTSKVVSIFESCAMRTDIVGETKSLHRSKVEDPNKAVSMKGVVKQSSLGRGFLQRGFLNQSMQPTCLKCRSRRHQLLLLRKLGWKGLLPFWVVAALLTLKRMRIPGLMVCSSLKSGQ